MKIRWPRGKWNGQRIIGFSFTFRIFLWDCWSCELYWRHGIYIIKAGPIILNFEGRYEQ